MYCLYSKWLMENVFYYKANLLFKRKGPVVSRLWARFLWFDMFLWRLNLMDIFITKISLKQQINVTFEKIKQFTLDTLENENFWWFLLLRIWKLYFYLSEFLEKAVAFYNNSDVMLFWCWCLDYSRYLPENCDFRVFLVKIAKFAFHVRKKLRIMSRNSNDPQTRIFQVYLLVTK